MVEFNVNIQARESPSLRSVYGRHHAMVATTLLLPEPDKRTPHVRREDFVSRLRNAHLRRTLNVYVRALFSQAAILCP